MKGIKLFIIIFAAIGIFSCEKKNSCEDYKSDVEYNYDVENYIALLKANQ